MANFVQNNCRVIAAHLTTTGNTTLFAATGYTQAIGIRAANLTGNNVSVTINYYSIRQNDQFRLLYQGAVPGNGAVFFPLEAMAMDPADEIRIQAGSGNAIDVLLTVAEIPGRSG